MDAFSNRLRLVLPPALACSADITATLVGQPAAYWAGDRAAVREYNPVARELLEWHPMLLPAAALLGLVVLTVILLAWRNRRLAYALAFAVTFAQSVAAGGWMIRAGMVGWIGALALLVCAERLLAWADDAPPRVAAVPSP